MNQKEQEMNNRPLPVPSQVVEQLQNSFNNSLLSVQEDKPSNQQQLVLGAESDLFPNIVGNTSINREHLNAIWILLIQEDGELTVCRIDVPAEEFTMESMLQYIGVPFRSNKVRVAKVNFKFINYVVAVGDLQKLDLDVLVRELLANEALQQLVFEPIAPMVNQTPSSEHSKEMPQKLIETKFAVCTNCGYLSQDFNKCFRCKKQLPENVKYIVSQSRSVKKRKTDDVKVIPNTNNGKNKQSISETLVMNREMNLQTADDSKMKDKTAVNSTTYMSSEKVLNNQLNAFLEDLKIPCKFRSKGCNVEISRTDFENHLNKCIFQEVKCLMLKDSCNWKGTLKDLLGHIEELHSQDVVIGWRNMFSFKINLINSTNIVKILKNKNETYILKIQKLKDTRTLLHFIRDIKTVSQPLEMIIKYNGENSQYKVKTKCLPFDAACNTNNGTKIRLITLNEIAENNGNITVTINLDVGESENVNEEVLKCLECPVCQQLMRPPIYQCTTGHSFCNICRTKLNECTTCRQPLSNTRNFSLEGFTAFVKYSCAYNQFGCNAIFAVNEISQHERSCEFKVYPCPISSCDYVAKYFAVKSHFKEMHNDCLVESTIYQGDFDPRYNCCTSETVKYLFEHCNIYKFTFKRSNEVCSFQVRILNDVDTNSKFFYVVSISDPERKQRKMTKSNLCLTRDVPITDYNVVSFLYSDLLSYRDFSNNDQIVYCCEIYEFKPVML